jgi:hypothetical protein
MVPVCRTHRHGDSTRTSRSTATTPLTCAACAAEPNNSVVKVATLGKPDTTAYERPRHVELTNMPGAYSCTVGSAELQYGAESLANVAPTTIAALQRRKQQY